MHEERAEVVSGKVVSPAFELALVAALLLPVGCRSPEPRALDAAPVESALATPLDANRAEAEFAIDTGGDQMGGPAREAALRVVVRFDSRELRQTIASCREIGRGSALGDVGGSVLDLAVCGPDLYRLIAEPGSVRVEREDEHGARTTVTAIGVPRSLTAAGVTPPRS
jgi:hypothetical protein